MATFKILLDSLEFQFQYLVSIRGSLDVESLPWSKGGGGKFFNVF